MFLRDNILHNCKKCHVKTKNRYRLSTTYLKTYDICNFTAYTLFGVAIFYRT